MQNRVKMKPCDFLVTLQKIHSFIWKTVVRYFTHSLLSFACPCLTFRILVICQIKRVPSDSNSFCWTKNILFCSFFSLNFQHFYLILIYCTQFSDWGFGFPYLSPARNHWKLVSSRTWLLSFETIPLFLLSNWGWIFLVQCKVGLGDAISAAGLLYHRFEQIEIWKEELTIEFKTKNVESTKVLFIFNKVLCLSFSVSFFLTFDNFWIRLYFFLTFSTMNSEYQKNENLRLFSL